MVLTMFVNETNDHSAKAYSQPARIYAQEKTIPGSLYSELYKLLEICATIPVTSACNERSHSKLKLIKTETRSTSGDERT